MGALGKIFKGIGGFLDRFRKVMHFIFMLFFFLILIAGLSPEPTAKIAKGSALMLNPAGPLVDQLSGDPVQRSLDKLTGNDVPQTLARDVIDAINTAKTDERIELLVLDVQRLTGAGLTKLDLVAAALEDFKTSGKKIVAYGDFYTQGQYHLVSHADEVYMHPSGILYIDGFGRFRMFYKDAIDKLSIDWNVFKVGEYKSFVEPYLRNDMSPEDRASSLVWMGQLWDAYKEKVESARGLDAGVIKNYTSNFRAMVEESEGDLAKPALDLGLVDELWTRDQFSKRVLETVKKDPVTKKFKRVSLQAYVQKLRAKEDKMKGDQVGVLVASGQILDGDQPPGTIGGKNMAALLQKARNNKDLDALVMYIDSPGGSKFASEVIQREIQLWKETERPFIAVMSSVAASGGYWLAMEGDEIWASPNTITGSIGIGGYIPTFQRSLARLGVNVDGVGTTPLSGSARIDRELSSDVKTIMQKSMEHGYHQFISNVAKTRDMSIEEVDKIARGRVWSGKDAQELGLVDRMGTLQDGIASAANLAGLGDNYQVNYIERELSFQEQLTMMFSTRMRSFAKDVPVRSTRVGWQEVIERLDLTSLDEQLSRLTSFNDPKHLYVHCFCAIP